MISQKEMNYWRRNQSSDRKIIHCGCGNVDCLLGVKARTHKLTKHEADCILEYSKKYPRQV